MGGRSSNVFSYLYGRQVLQAHRTAVASLIALDVREARTSYAPLESDRDESYLRSYFQQDLVLLRDNATQADQAWACTI